MNFFIENHIKQIKLLKIAFAGTSEYSAKHLNQLIFSKYKIVAVFTQPNSISGRGLKHKTSPVKTMALNYNIPIFELQLMSSKKICMMLKKLKVDLMLVVAYGVLIPTKILQIFPKGCINIHASLLPRWRGAAPIQRAILKGDKKTGVTVIQMNEKIDCGNILYSVSCKIHSTDTSASLLKKIEKLSITSMFIVLEKISKGITLYDKKQNKKKSSYAKKINKKEAKLNFLLPAKTLERTIRAFNPWPIAYFIVNTTQLKVWEANVITSNLNTIFKIGEILTINSKGLQINTARNILNITKIQFPGKNIINSVDLFNSYKNFFIIGNKIK